MVSASEKLINHIKLNKGKATFNRSFYNNIYPFPTRNPERAKFENGFTPIIGAISRYSMGLKLQYNNENFSNHNTYADIDFINAMSETQKIKVLDKIFDFERLKSINHPYITNYYPLSDNSEKNGEMQIAQYITAIFNLSDNQKWQQFIDDKNAKNLIEKILLDSINVIPKENKRNSFENILNKQFQTKIEDLEFLLRYKDFALKNLDKFFAFYYFQHIIQTIINVDNINSLKDGTQVYPMYYTLETEKLTASRKTNEKGYNQIKRISGYTLVNDDLLGYLNILINALNKDKKFYSLTKILNLDKVKKTALNEELLKVLKLYKEKNDKDDSLKDDLVGNIELFKKWLKEDISNETSTRFHKSVEDIGSLMFLKNRGVLGKTLTLKKDMLILLTALIVKEKKMLIKDVFVEFENRGVFFDRYTKEEIISFYEKMNILDKKSDSGEVKYVKPVL